MISTKSQEAHKLLIQREQAKTGLCTAMSRMLQMDAQFAVAVQQLLKARKADQAELKFLRTENSLLHADNLALKKKKRKLKKSKTRLKVENERMQQVLNNPDEMREWVEHCEAELHSEMASEYYRGTDGYH